MKKVLLRALGLVALPLVLTLVFQHYLGLLFAASIAAAAIAGWAFGVSAAFTYLAIAWKVYAGLGIFTFAFLTTFSFQHCCVGMQSFRSHLEHKGWRDVGENLLGAIIWPWSWFCLDRFLKGWFMDLPTAILNAIEYWLVSSWSGVTFTYIDMQSGEETTTRVKSPDEAQRAIKDALLKSVPKDDAA
jgi:hypothetical protein